MLWPYWRDHRNEKEREPLQAPAAVTQYGRNEKLFTFIDEIAADCPRKQRLSDYDPCARSAPICPRCFDSYRTRHKAAILKESFALPAYS